VNPLCFLSGGKRAGGRRKGEGNLQSNRKGGEKCEGKKANKPKRGFTSSKFGGRKKFTPAKTVEKGKKQKRPRGRVLRASPRG